MSEYSVVEQARARIVPLLERVVAAHEDDADVQSLAFFTGLLVRAHAMQEETDLAALFFELSTAAFQGFAFSPDQAAAIDELLAASEHIAFALTAPSDRPH